MLATVTVAIISDNLALVVDAYWIAKVAAWRVDRGVDTVAEKEALLAGVADEIIPNDLPPGIDAACDGFNATWRING